MTRYERVHGGIHALYTAIAVLWGWLAQYLYTASPGEGYIFAFSWGVMAIPMTMALWVYVLSPLNEGVLSAAEKSDHTANHPLPHLIWSVLNDDSDHVSSAGWDVEKRGGELEIARCTDKGNHIELVSTVPLSWEPPEEFGGDRE